MPDSLSSLLANLRLAVISHDRQQMTGRDRFLLLAGLSAVRAGYPVIARRCRDLVLANNPRHLVSRYDTLADALRDPDFAGFEQQLRRFCPYERAEHLLQARGDTAVPSPDADPDEIERFLGESLARMEPSPD